MLSRRKFLGTVGALGSGGAVLSLAAGCAGTSHAPFPLTVAAREVMLPRPGDTGRPPNIVLINCDDLGYGDLGCYGGTAIKTPRIDAMAAAGARFTDFHSCDSVCTPSRAGMLTGRYPARMRLDSPLTSDDSTFSEKLALSAGLFAGKLSITDAASENGAAGLNRFEITLGQALQLRGYRTAMVGKWHLGNFDSAPEFNPTHYGFGQYFGPPHSNDIRPMPLYRNRDRIEADVADLSKLTGLYTDEAIKVMEEYRDAPFFLYLAHTFPHRPLVASPAFQGKSAGGLYGDVVEEIDWHTGRLLDALKRLGLEENTVVMFTSDNGPWYDGSAGALRGHKGQSFEGGFRVPLLAQWKGTVPAGATCTANTMNIDLFPTFMDLAGMGLPKDRLIDGVSLATQLLNPKASLAQRDMFFYHQGRLEAMRRDEWKLIREINHYVWPMPINKFLGHLSPYSSGPLPMLFNLGSDPNEAYNLAHSFPDKVLELERGMAHWSAKMASNRYGLAVPG